ncbi:MAG: OB-fold domain-containing protein [Myxococcota bacterium]|nr:OB-fold domain-containing protein [Myxococcota bacterium]
MPLTGSWLGMSLAVDEADAENHAFFGWCGKHELRLQRWKSNGLLSYPPGTACPWDGSSEYEWAPVEGRGTVMSYSEVHHPILPAFRDQVPYLLLLVELDTQRGQPSEHEALRVLANLVTSEGELAPPETVRRVGIGTRVRMVFADVGEGFALPQWTIDESATQETPWRYPQE